MLRLRSLALSFALSLLLASVAACSSGDSGSASDAASSSDVPASDTSDTRAAGDGSPSDTSVVPPGDGAAGTDARNPPPSAAACDEYCALMAKSCTAANDQFTDVDCSQLCVRLSAWPTGEAGATSGNTLGCRVTYAKKAAADPAANCPIAGKYGGGVCGTRCEGFCRLVARNCTGANQIYADDAACMATCATWPIDKQECESYHLNAAADDPVTHCPHGTPTSHACG